MGAKMAIYVRIMRVPSFRMPYRAETATRVTRSKVCAATSYRRAISRKNASRLHEMYSRGVSHPLPRALRTLRNINDGDSKTWCHSWWWVERMVGIASPIRLEMGWVICCVCVSPRSLCTSVYRNLIGNYVCVACVNRRHKKKWARSIENVYGILFSFYLSCYASWSYISVVVVAVAWWGGLGPQRGVTICTPALPQPVTHRHKHMQTEAINKHGGCETKMGR